MENHFTEFEDIEEEWNRMVEEVRNREQHLEATTLHGQKADIADSLGKVADKWRGNEKSLRALPVINTFEARTGETADPEIVRSLTWLDGYINNLDDTVDTKNPDSQEKLGFIAGAAFTGSLSNLEIPNSKQEQIREDTIRYFTDLFQIPGEERQTLETMEANPKNPVDAISHNYGYRARDIDLFVDVASQLYDFEKNGEMKDNLRTYRAIDLIYKDTKPGDVKRDLQDDDITPVLWLVNKHGAEKAGDIISDALNQKETFQYSGDKHYQEVLEYHETDTDNLSKNLERAEKLLFAHGADF